MSNQIDTILARNSKKFMWNFFDIHFGSLNLQAFPVFKFISPIPCSQASVIRYDVTFVNAMLFVLIPSVLAFLRNSFHN